MIVKFFKRGGITDNHYNSGGRAVQQYLLGKDYQDGVASRDNARLLSGDPEMVTELINDLSFAKIYTAGCLAFEGEESQQVTEAMKLVLMAEFEQCLFAGLDSAQYVGYWVEHTDKIDELTKTPRLELNFVFANVELTTGKALPVYYHPIDCNRVDCFKEIKNLEMNLTDPNALELKRLTRIGDKLPQNVKDTVALIDETLTTAFLKEEINSRADVLTYLSEHYEVTAVKNQSISIKNPHGGSRPIRLSGAFYEKTFESRSTLGEEPDPASYPRRYRDSPDSERIDKLKADYQRLCDKRRAELSKRFEKRASKRTESNLEQANRVESAIQPTYRFVIGELVPYRAFGPSPDTLGQYAGTDYRDRPESFAVDSGFHRTVGNTDTEPANNTREPVREPARDTIIDLRPSDRDPLSPTNRERESGLSGVFATESDMAQESGESNQSPKQITVTPMGDILEPAGNLAGGESRRLGEVGDLEHLYGRDTRHNDIHSSHLRGVSGVPTDQSRGRLDHVTESSKPSVRDRVGGLVRKVIERATHGIRDFQEAIRARQSLIDQFNNFAQYSYRRIKNSITERREQRQQQQFDFKRTAGQFTDTQSAVSQASRTIGDSLSGTAQQSPKPHPFTDSRNGKPESAQRQFRVPESAITAAKPSLTASQPTTTNGQSSPVNQAERLDKLISGAEQQNQRLDETLEFIARRQTEYAEQQRQTKLKQQLKERTEFELAIAQSIQAYFAKLKQAKIEADYDYERYSLNRALQAVVGLRLSQKIGDTGLFLQASQDYQQAMQGISRPKDEDERMYRGMDGSIGFIEKLEQRDLMGIHYKPRNPQHRSLKAEGIALAESLNNVAQHWVKQAIQNQFIECDYPAKPYEDKDRRVLKPLLTLFDTVKEHLATATKSLSETPPSPKPVLENSRRRGPGF